MKNFAVLIMLLFFGCLTSSAADNFTFNFISGAHNENTVLIQSPNGKIILINSGADNGEMIKKLETLEIKNIDLLIGTVPQKNYIGGFEYILDNYDVKTIGLPRTYQGDEAYNNLIKYIKSKNRKIKACRKGTEFNELDSDLNIICLSPETEENRSGDDLAVTVKINYKKSSLIIMSGNSQDTLKDLLKDKNLLKSQLVATNKIIHPDLLQEADPEYIISPVEIKKIPLSAKETFLLKNKEFIVKSNGNSFSFPLSGKENGSLKKKKVPSVKKNTSENKTKKQNLADTDDMSTSLNSDKVHVKGYYRKDGTYVKPHTRSKPKR